MGSLVIEKNCQLTSWEKKEGMVIVYISLILCDVTVNDVIMPSHKAPKGVIVSQWIKAWIPTEIIEQTYRAVLIYSKSVKLN